MPAPNEMQSQAEAQSWGDAPDEELVVIDEEASVSDPGAVPRTAVSDPGAVPQTAGAERRWSEIQAMFVDDPRGSVQRAADLIDTAVEELITSVRQRQASLASSWQNSEAGTEKLRGTLQDYRAFLAAVRDMPAVGAASATGATGARPGAKAAAGAE